MIYQDKDQFPVESHMDGGDSSMRAGMGLLTGLFNSTSFDCTKYEASWGWLTRHPTQVPWNNKWNFTRDQLIPLVAGLNAIGRNAIIRRVALWHFLRLGFCQDFQRDQVGTWKHPWPSTYINNGQTVSKSFDFADPLLPNDWWPLIFGGELYPLYILWPICLLFTLFAIYGSKTHEEQNQMIAELSFHPKWVMRLYLKFGGWANGTNNNAYWNSRGENEYAISINNYVDQRTK